MTIQPPDGTQWRLFECADCPDDATRYRFVAPVTIGAHPDAAGPITDCPACDSYLGMCGSQWPIEVTR